MNANRHVSIIALHGIARRDEEIEQIVPPVIEYAGAPGVRWLFPRAPRRSVTILGGSEARAWFDTLSYDRSLLDKAGIEKATEEVSRMVRAEPLRRRVILLGFSQGGVLALNAGLRLQSEVDGIVALATAIPFPERVSEATSQSPLVFFGHGLLDPCASYRLGWESHQLLESKHYETEWHTYAYGHSTGRRQLRDVSDWLHRRFLNGAAAPLPRAA
jgi:phospholipase/carboxylesterase